MAYGHYQKIPCDERHCKTCGTGAVEDEFHFAFDYSSVQVTVALGTMQTIYLKIFFR
jgi:hypothetical protein